MLTEVPQTGQSVNLQKDVHHIVTLITSGVLDQTKEDVVKKLRELADELDAKQRDMNIAKTSFASTGIVGSGLAIAGVVAAPFTMGASLGLTIAGVAVGVTSGIGGLATAIADRVVNSQALKDAEAAINRYMEKVNELIDMVNFFYFSTADNDEIEQEEIAQEELALIPNAKEREKVEILLRGMKTGIDAGSSVAHIGATVGVVTADAAAATGRSVFTTLGTGMKVARIGGAVLSVLTVPLDVHTIITNSLKLHHKTPSEVGEQIRDMARTLDQHQILEAEDESVY